LNKNSPNKKIDRRQEIVRQNQNPIRKKLFVFFLFLSITIVSLIIAYFYYQNYVGPSRSLAVRIGDVEYTRGDIVKLLQAKQKQVEMLGGNFKTGKEIFESLNTVVEAEIIVKISSQYGITSSDEEIDANIRNIFSPKNSEKTEDAIQIEREFQERYNAFLNEIQLSEKEFRNEIKKNILRDKFRKYITENIPTTADQVRLHRIALANTDEIEIIKGKYYDLVKDSLDPEILRAAFKGIVREFSKSSPENLRKGGDLGWIPQGIYDIYDPTIFALDIGKLSPEIPNYDNDQQIFIFMVSEKESNRELDPEDFEIIKNNTLQNFLNEERKNHDVYSILNKDIYQWIIDELKLTKEVTPTPSS
tara:strand:+ start:13680 stop:14762 length:1083 start_codon:yes stop_codon:yes gene_type:complete